MQQSLFIIKNLILIQNNTISFCGGVLFLKDNSVKIYKAISLFVVAILLMSCSVSKKSKDSAQYTLQEDVKQNENSVKLKNIYTIQGIYPLDWFDEDTILVKKENRNKPKTDVTPGVKAYPNNLYKYNIKTGEETLLVSSTEDIGYAVLSPDKRYVFYQENTDITATGYIYEVENKKSTRISNEEEIPAGIGRWIDNNTVIFYSTVNGSVYSVEVSGYRKQIVRPNGLFMRDPIKVNDKVYFVTNEYSLYEYDIKTKKLTKLLEDAAEFIPDNKGKHFAFIPLGRKGIDIRDEKANKITAIYDKGGIGGFSWSKDSKKLAYIALLPNNNKETLFIADGDSGKSEQLLADIPQTFPTIHWSPSQKKLLMTAYKIINNKNEAYAVVIELE